jgi:ribosomal protein S18 acetylase RimI-like enzyme
VLIPVGDSSHCSIVSECGFSHLSRLVYLRRLNQAPLPASYKSPEISWLQFAPDKLGLFCDALERTYQESHDCPELTGLRSTKDVLASHQATGEHLPSLWWVACTESGPVGIMLLGRLPLENLLEVVYTGVAQAYRGQGIGDALLERAVGAAEALGAKGLTLAVDERNTPARRLYDRWGFVETVRRDAWIATPFVK